MTLPDLISRLEAVHGTPQPPAVTDPFELILWENVAYLVDDDRRAEVFERLREQVGFDPEEILGTPTEVLAEIIRDGGMHPERRAEKLSRQPTRSCDWASRGSARWSGRAGEGAKGTAEVSGDRRPGADKILLFSHARISLAPGLEHPAHAGPSRLRRGG